jgi:hypothetical protein
MPSIGLSLTARWKETMMRILWAVLALMVVTSATPVLAKGGRSKKAPSSASSAADPNAVVGKTHGGKLWILAGPLPGSEGEYLSKWLSSHPSATEVSKKPTEERWSISYIAVLKSLPAKGPMTITFVDKKEPRTLVAQDSSQMPGGGSVVFQEPYDIDVNNGFNKGHTYIMKVGQLIKGRFKSYVSGEITLK